MRAYAKQVLREVAAARRLSVEEICGKGRVNKLLQARVEIATRLSAAKYSCGEIGTILGGRDHATIAYYLGRLDRKPSPPKWKKPVVRHLCFVRAPKKLFEPRRYLIPYAGADMREYKWKERASP